MTPSKRKRASDASTASDNESDANSTTAAPVEPVQSPFTLQLLRKSQTAKRQKNEEGKWTSPKEETSPLEKGAPIYYKVAPREEWESMKKYKQFVVQENTFSLGEYVLVNNGIAATAANVEEKDLWVARVMECRAENPSSVWIRVMYLYWPHELPEHLKRPYYGQREMIASNHMEIIDAQCVDDKAEVVHVLEADENSTPSATLYWRQYFDFLENKVSPPLRRDCTCNKPHNPDLLLIRCLSDSCKKWLHEDCLAKDACRKQWDRMKASDEFQVPTGEDDSTIKLTSAAAPAESSHVAKPKGGKKGRGRRKSKANTGDKKEEPWQGILEGFVERSPPEDESSTEISGTCIIKKRDGDSVIEIREPLYCLFCQTALGTKGEPLTPPRDT